MFRIGMRADARKALALALVDHPQGGSYFALSGEAKALVKLGPFD